MTGLIEYSAFVNYKITKLSFLLLVLLKESHFKNRNIIGFVSLKSKCGLKFKKKACVIIELCIYCIC